MEEGQEPQTNQTDTNQANQSRSKFGLKWVLIFVMIFSVLFAPAAFGEAAIGIFYLLRHGLSGRFGGHGSTMFGGGLSSDVPEPYRSLFAEAGQKYNVQPAFIAAIFYAGEHHNNWLNPDGPWATSSKGARGPFQFLCRTWNSWNAPVTGSCFTDPLQIKTYNGIGQDGDGDGIADVQNLKDSSFAAAYYLSTIGAGGNTTDPKSLMNAASKYNSGKIWIIGITKRETRRYVPRVLTAFNDFIFEYYETVEDGSDDFGEARGGTPGSWHWVLPKEVVDKGSHGSDGCFRSKSIGSGCAADYGNREGFKASMPVYAITDGTITFQKNFKNRKHPSDSYMYWSGSGKYWSGYLATFISSDGRVKAFYAHVYREDISLKDKFNVNGGEVFAKIYPTRAHLHFELNVDGQWISAKNHISKYQELKQGY